tara:strand:- start:470 stop:1954 length:1485 start_codon:yes stop_codon:yes gene_type:complete
MAINPGDNLNSVALPQKKTLASNYIDFTAEATKGWAQQYLPDLMEKEAEVFGNRTIAGFLEKVGAEESMTADQVIWSEQGRLHLAYTGTVNNTDGVFTITHDIDGQAITASAAAEHGVRLNDMVIVATAEGTVKCMVTDIGDGANAHKVTVKPYENDNIEDLSAFGNGASEAATILVIGSEYGKGTNGQSANAEGPKTVNPVFKSFTNKPIIIKDYYEINGSDVSQIGWVEISGEDGQSGYLWYLKAEGDTRQRFTDYLEMTMLEAVKGAPATSVVDSQIGTAGDSFGTEGLFAAIEDRGNITTGVTGVNAATDLAEFDAILAEFDKQGAIEENMMFVNRATSLAMDDMLASMNSYGAGGTSYGVFDNEEDMALNLGFSGFRRGSYDFYKSDFRYLNDKGTRGSINDRDAVAPIRGVIIPAGVSTVYDQNLGKNLKRPFLHVRYRASQTDNRRMKTWTTGSVGAETSDLDAMQVHYLSERCLVVQGANNFMLMK